MTPAGRVLSRPCIAAAIGSWPGRTDAASQDRSPLAPPLALDQAAPIVGRDAVLEKMHAAYALAEPGARQVLFIAGEPGVGKTTLVSTLVAQVGGQTPTCQNGHGPVPRALWRW